MSVPIRIGAPLDADTVARLRAGDEVRICGFILTARDVAHKRLYDVLKAGKPLPVELANQVIYFAGPTPARPGRVIGAAGPTTSYRMDAYSPVLIRDGGIRGMIGKGDRSAAVVAAMRETGCVYFAAVGGAGALIAEAITSAEVVCYDDLGPEAIRRLRVENFPAIVAIDSCGESLYTQGPAAYRREAP